MNRALQRYLETASGLTQVTRQRAEQVVKGLVKQGEVAADQLEKTVDELLKRSEDNRRAIAQLVRAETEKVVNRLGLARQRDVERLATEVERRAPVASPPRQAAAGKRATAVRGPVTAAKTTETADKALPAKKAVGKKAAGKKTGAAKKAVGKKTGAAKKAAAAKQVPGAKKVAAKKATAKKATAKKATAKKASVAKKTSAKRTATAEASMPPPPATDLAAPHDLAASPPSPPSATPSPPPGNGST